MTTVTNGHGCVARARGGHRPGITATSPSPAALKPGSLFRWVDHTAELELEIEARSEHDVLADALAAISELLEVDPEDASRPWEPARRTVRAIAADRPALLAAWLDELVFLAESEGFVATGIERLELSACELTATVSGVLDDPPPLVKAVTYHRLLFEPAGDRYVARVVLDV